MLGALVAQDVYFRSAFQDLFRGLISTSLELISIENEDWVKVMYDCLLSEGLEGGGGNYYILGFQVALLIF